MFKEGTVSVLKVGSSFVDGPELVSRALPILPNAVSVVTASGDGRPTGAESDAFAQIKRLHETSFRSIGPNNYQNIGRRLNITQ